MTRPESVVLRDERTASDWRSISARLEPEGDLIIEGHDLGRGVGSLFGYSEYEWSLTIAAVDTSKLLAALNAGQSLLKALQQRFSGDQADGLQAFLKDRGIPYSFWNRIGD